ncbi:MAG: DUF2092 domain-containing protein [Myxococcales bacterium]
MLSARSCIDGKRLLAWSGAGLLALGSISVAGTGLAEPTPADSAKAKSTQRTDARRDPRAMTALQRMKDYLRRLPAFSVRAEISRDEVVQDDFKLERSMHLFATAQRPDCMRVESSGDDGERLIVYDGKALNVYAKSENYFGSMEAPATLKETLEIAVGQRDVEVPLLDVFYVAMGGELGEPIDAAGFIGTSLVDGTPCDHVAFRGDKVDWQLWIEQGKRPVPHKLVVTTRDQTSHPQYRAVIGWDVAPRIENGMFTFAPPQGALPMSIGLGQPALLNAVTGAKKPKAQPPTNSEKQTP